MTLLAYDTSDNGKFSLGNSKSVEYILQLIASPALSHNEFLLPGEYENMTVWYYIKNKKNTFVLIFFERILN